MIATRHAVTLLHSTGSIVHEHPALILSMGMHTERTGSNGEPSLELITLDEANKRFAGGPDWQHALTRHIDVVHESHDDFTSGRTAFAYREYLAETPLPSTEELFESAARVAHEATRILCALFGDHSHLTWGKTPEELRISARAGIRRIYEQPTLSSAEQHEAWMQAMTALGWQYGETRDVKKKTNPSLKPLTELLPQWQAKGYLFTAVVRAFFDIEQEKLPSDVATNTEPTTPATDVNPSTATTS